MGEKTSIGWTHHTFNCWIGCTKVSPACKHCYAAVNTFTRTQRAQGRELWGDHATRHFFADKHWREPLKWNRDAEKAGERRRVFCGSMMDVFEIHEVEATDVAQAEARTRLWNLIGATPQLDWLLLTKRPENAEDVLPLEWWLDGLPPNVWVGATVENQEYADLRIPHLLKIPARVRFLSCEPILSPISLEAYLGIDHDQFRAGALGTDRDGHLLDGRGRRDLETLSPLEWSSAPNSSASSVGATGASGGAGYERLPARAIHGGGGAASGLRASRHLADPQSSADSGRFGDQPHRRHQDAQRTLEFGDRDQEREPAPRAASAGKALESQVSGREADHDTGLRDPQALRHEGNDAGGNREAVRRLGADGQSHRVAQIVPPGSRIHWVIAGGESGHHHREHRLEWSRSLRDQCAAASVPYFFKQLGEHASEFARIQGTSRVRLQLAPRSKGESLDEILRIRQFPTPETTP